jgi:two-component system, NtrC family, sensor kinase
MRRRDEAVGKAIKTQRRKTLKRRNTAKAARRRKASVDANERIALLTRERDEAQERQTATAEVLKVISRSSVDLDSVLDTLVQTVARLCRADQVYMFHLRHDLWHLIADYGLSAETSEFFETHPFTPGRGSTSGRAALERRAVLIPDVLQDPEYTLSEGQEIAGYRTTLSIPLLREDTLIGVYSIARTRVEPFTDKEIELATSFASQAVIAIENARLLNELRQRTGDLSESLEQQTATSEVLKIISSSPGQLEPVFKAMLENAVQICAAKFGSLVLLEEDSYRRAALYNAPAAFVEQQEKSPVVPLSASPVLTRVAKTKKVTQVADVLTEHPEEAIAKFGKARTLLCVPMLREDRAVGAFSIYRQEVRPFTDKQIELVQNFAAQAVIAIENTRLLNELRESLEQQTATADVLKVISSSPGELKPVFQAMLEQATRICDAKFGIVFRYEGGLFHPAASLDLPPALADFMIKQGAFPPKSGQLFGRLCEAKTVINVVDRANDPEPSPSFRYGGARSSIAVPMRKDGELVGALFIYRTEVQPFTGKQIELVTNFAAQAVIAIENMRLLNELRESLQQQTATADVLKVISRSTFDLSTVLNTLVESAARLCDGQDSVILLRDGELLVFGAHHGTIPTDIDKWPLTRKWTAGRAVIDAKPVHIHDLTAAGDEFPDGHAMAVRMGHRTILSVPLLRENEAIGCISVRRSEVRPFTEKQIELVGIFADQAVIAIQNARLLSELRESLQQQTATADVLKVISRSTFDLQTVLDTLTESAARLCEADRSMIFQRDGDVYRFGANYGFSSEAKQYALKYPLRPDRGGAVGRVSLEKRAIHIPDVLADSEYRLTDYQQTFGYRTILAVPLLRGGEVIGVLSVTRDVVNPFTEKQIELVTTFADQAGIAIENVRLFDEVQARTRELAASLENLRNTQDRLVQTQKLASLGQLTAGIAHEIKNPLNFVNNFSGVSAELIDELQETLKDSSLNEVRRSEIAELMDTLRSNLDKVVQHGKRADAIVKNMLLHSHQGSGEHRPVVINALVEESLKLAYHGARAEKNNFNVMVEQSFDPDAGEADIFPQEVTRVLLNLISNGVYATKKKAPRDGETYNPTLTASTKDLGDHVVIRIRDNGIGIPPDVKENMFNPFFTTKPAGEGTGLGLSISHDIIVKQHGGSIEVETEPGEFTEVRIILPRTAASISK